MANGSNQQWGLTVLRVIVGIVFLVHGAQKLFVFGFHGVAGMLGGMGIRVPAVSAVILTLVEFLGGIALILGVVTRWAAALIVIDMMVAVLVFTSRMDSSKCGCLRRGASAKNATPANSLQWRGRVV